MADPDFGDYLDAEIKAMQAFRREECQRRGCPHAGKNDTECSHNCDNSRNRAAIRWIADGEAAQFRKDWYGE